jgi:hypothetical protein
MCGVALDSQLQDPLCYHVSVPELSRFFGIIIRMYMEVGLQHQLPHFHAYYQEYAAVFSLDPIELIAGSLPRRQQRLVEAWAELHQGELIADWQRLQAGQLPLPIQPLD